MFSSFLRTAVITGFFFFASWAMTPAPAMAAQDLHSTARLFSPITATNNQNTIPVAVDIKLDKGWKTYWRTPGDAGLAPRFTWDGSDNFKNAHVFYPTPERFTMFDIDSIGYHDRVVFPINITAMDPKQAIDLKLKLDILVCEDICIPETHHLSFSLPAGIGTESADHALYTKTLKDVPVFSDKQFTFKNMWVDSPSHDEHYLYITADTNRTPTKNADVFIEHPVGYTFSKPEITFDSLSGSLTLKSQIHASDTRDMIEKELSAEDPTITYRSGDFFIEGKLPLRLKPENGSFEAPSFAARAMAFDWNILIYAFLGGLILNLMPCVLPVLSLKILSVVSHGGKDSRATIFKNFMASALGILFSFWVMAGVLIALKSAGQTIGWGIQFQQPAFLIFLTVVLLGFAANMWGLFDIPLPRFIAKNIPAKHEHDPTLTGHFLTGAFATLLATPCTAPFLGTAVGFALARGAFEIILTFTFLGIGLAFPYMVLAVSPRLFKYMPKPGRWMAGLKKVLAVVLLVTAVWLMTILVTITTTPTLALGWNKFDVNLIAPAVEEGKIVVVDVTADWCLTCKANKRLVLDTKEIQDAFITPNILKLQADWTHRDEDIAAYLRMFGKYGIPFNVIYGPGAPAGVVLPELLTKDAVLNALSEAAGE